MLDFDFSKDYILEDDFVRLSPLTIEHIEDLAGLSTDKSIWTFFLEKGNGIKNLSSYVQAAIDNREKGTEYPFVVFDKTQNLYAGTTRLYNLISDLESMKLGHTWYGKAFQGTGLNKHCKYLLFEFAFERVGAIRIGFGVNAENIRSIKALESVGCSKEGVLRDFLPQINGVGRTDLILLSLLKDEWEESVKRELSLKLNLTKPK